MMASDYIYSNLKISYEVHDENEKRVQLKTTNKKGELVLVVVRYENGTYTCATQNLDKLTGWKKFATNLSIDEAINYITKNLK